MDSNLGLKGVLDGNRFTEVSISQRNELSLDKKERHERSIVCPKNNFWSQFAAADEQLSF